MNCTECKFFGTIYFPPTKEDEAFYFTGCFYSCNDKEREVMYLKDVEGCCEVFDKRGE